MKTQKTAGWTVLWTIILVLVFAGAVGGDPESQFGLRVERDCRADRTIGGIPAGPWNSLVIDAQEGRRGKMETGLSMHYNRVDGLFLQLGVDTKWKRPAKLRLFAWGGYAFK
ncbi:hypothetical protein ACFL0G_06415, partial [Candidatus Zixiibacteriota bacterium]